MSKTLSLSLICSNDYKNIQSSLKEIKKISHLFKDIVVVDGNSSDGTVDYISRTIPEIKIIKVNYKNRLAQRIESFNNTKGDLVLIMDYR
jgi:glycosyltransferase involved in cell wall biosynthesis